MQTQKNTREQIWTILSLIQWTTNFFRSRHIESPRSSAEILLAHALGASRVDLYVNHDKPLTAEELARFRVYVKRRANYEPTAYIIGYKEFWSLRLSVTKDVLIPRPETEHLVEAGIELLPHEVGDRPQQILELGVGSGAVILALAQERPGHGFFASDHSPAALAVAQHNAAALGLDQAVHFFLADWLQSLHPDKARFDIILSNPPYIQTQVIETLAPEIRLFEPLTALDGQADGLAALRHLIQHASSSLSDSGWLLLEIGYDQRTAVMEIATALGCWDNISCTKDYSGHDRIIRLKKIGNQVF